MASGLAGIAAFWAIYEAGEHGGEVVYEYAGGVGTRSGETEDVQNLLVAGLYNQSRLAREAGRLDEAARLIEELARQRPDDPNVKFLLVESQLKDRNDAAGALAAAAALQGDPENPFFAMRRGLLMSDAYVALGHADSAKMVLTTLAERFPDSRMIKGALAKLP
jgi:predicted Zn-dependent protease